MPDDSHEHDLFGTGLLGGSLAPKRGGNLAERFLISSKERQHIVRNTPRIAVNHTVIYGACDPTTKEIRYIGKTCNQLRDRALSHYYSKGKSYRARWFQKLRRDGIIPEFFVLQEVGIGEDWAEAEQFWIAYFKSLGACLINQSNGGDGPVGLIRSEVTRAKMRANALRQFSDPVAKEAWLVALRTSLGTEAHKAKMSKIALEVQNRQDVKDKHVQAALQQHAEPGALERHGTAVKRAWANPIMRRKSYTSNRQLGPFVPVRIGTSLHRIILSVLHGGKTLDDIAFETNLSIERASHRMRHVLSVKHGIDYLYKDDGTYELILPEGITIDNLFRSSSHRTKP